MADRKQTTQLANLNANVGLSPSATRYLALFTAAPTDTTEGTEVTEAAYVAAGRPVIAFSAASGSPSATANSAQIDFPIVTGTGYTVVAVAICSAASGTGNQVYWKSVTSKAIAVGDRYQIPVGAVTVTEN